MNIQFMTAEKNGKPTGEKDWAGRPRYTYIPDYDELLKNATCDEERKAIINAKEIMERFGEGFAFEIVYTARSLHVDPYTCEHSLTWQLLQHPWHEDAWTLKKKSREEMIKDIEECIEYSMKRWNHLDS